jgi:ribosomal protein S18 acetylase RimI-like enzyme
MSNTISYSLNKASPAEITLHLLRADVAFVPDLSSRVDIHAYAEKLHDKADRFEAWINQELVGLMAAYCNQQQKGKTFVSSVSVWPKCQGKGIAGRLMQLCIEHAKNLGFTQMELDVNQQSLAALALYQKFGFNVLHSVGDTLTMSMTLERSNK